MNTATTARWLRPWTARSIRLARAKSTHTHQMMTAPGDRNTVTEGSFSVTRGGPLGRSRLQAGQGGQHANAGAARPLVDVKRRLVQVAPGRRARRAGAQPGHRPRHLVQEPGEVLAPEALRRLGD